MRFIARWQQFTAPVTAKAMEDTAFYRYNRLVSLNDVGGDPRRFGTSPAHFHAVNADDSEHRPHWLLGTSTHDSKRSEDLRTRLDVLSEIPDAWGTVIERWSGQADYLHAMVDGGPAPSRNDEYLLWQTLVGAWPLGGLTDASLEDMRVRVQAYMQKATREAKQHTSWLNPNEGYEKAVEAFIDGVLDRDASGGLLDDIGGFVDHIAPFGCANSLSLVALKLTSPGVPDIYHGCEQWNFSLVDPDNRRPVDFGRLQASLAELQAMYAQGVPTDQQWQSMRQNWTDGRIKHLVTWRLLQLRQKHPEVFRKGGYRPLEGEGALGQRLVAYARGAGDETVVTVAARLLRCATDRLPAEIDAMARLWQDTRLPLAECADGMGEAGDGGGWVDWFTGRPAVVATGSAGGKALDVGAALAVLPVAVFVPAAWMA